MAFNLTDDFIDAIRVQFKNVKSVTLEEQIGLEKYFLDMLNKEQLKKVSDADISIVSDIANKKISSLTY